MTVCPYFQELSPTTVEQYAAAGADAVAALLFVTDPADVPGAFDALDPFSRQGPGRLHAR